MNDMETAQAMRDKEEKDFMEANDEMQDAIDALNDALEELEGATHNRTEGVLLSVRESLGEEVGNGGAVALAKHQASLRKAADMGEHFLDKADARFLKRVLLGDVPEVDMKKLNRKANFKMRYKA